MEGADVVFACMAVRRRTAPGGPRLALKNLATYVWGSSSAILASVWAKSAARSWIGVGVQCEG